MRAQLARASEFLTSRSSSGDAINSTTCHQSGPALLPSTFPAHPHPPLLLFLLAPNPFAAFHPSNLLRSSRWRRSGWERREG
jgi:hypothetical protein